MVKVWIDSKVNYEEIFSAESLHQAPVIQKVDKAIHWINLYPLDSTILVSLTLILWLVICPVDSAIHLLNN